MNTDWLTPLKPMLEPLWVKIFLILAGSLLASFLVNAVIKRFILKLAGKTENKLDDRIIETARTPIFLTIIFIGVAWALNISSLAAGSVYLALRVMKSVAVIVWSVAIARIADQIFKWMGGLTRFKVVQPRTVPIFDILSFIIVWGGAVYLIFLTWDIDVTGWLASAGVVGIAVGFAAKDTLANLFAGFFIIADSPYKIGDYIVLGTGERGMVTDIGIRSTRLLTRDEIEIVVPNAVIANTKITNETGGPYEKERVRCTVSVAYGTDIDRAKDVLKSVALDNEWVCDHPEPRVRFRSFGESGLVLQLLGWIEEPVLRGRALDSLNTSVYKRFRAEGIEIPYSKHDVYIKSAPPDLFGNGRTPDTRRPPAQPDDN